MLTPQNWFRRVDCCITRRFGFVSICFFVSLEELTTASTSIDRFSHSDTQKNGHSIWWIHRHCLFSVMFCFRRMILFWQFFKMRALRCVAVKLSTIWSSAGRRAKV